jgi:hypothetical protein
MKRENSGPKYLKNVESKIKEIIKKDRVGKGSGSYIVR